MRTTVAIAFAALFGFCPAIMPTPQLSLKQRVEMLKEGPMLALGQLLVLPVSAQNETSGDALFSAIQQGRVDEVERLLKKGADPNAVDGGGTPAVMAATLFSNAEMVGLLLKHGAGPNRPGAGGTTALMWAAPDLEKVRLLVAAGANVNARSETDRTALLVAASYPGTVNVLRLLLDRGADLNAQDRTGASALGLAVRSADVDVVRFLVERGLDPNALSPAARRAGLARNDVATTDYLMSKGLRPTPDALLTTANWQSVEMVSRLIELGADVNATNSAQYGRTPLLTAVTSEAAGAEMLRLLLDRGADPNIGMTEGERPLDWAIYKGDRAKIEVLEQRGATRGNGPRSEPIAPPAPGGLRDPRASLTRSVARLLDVAPKFRDQAPCISCHHNALPALAAATVRRKGIRVDQVQARKNVDQVLAFFTNAQPRMMLGDPAVGGESLTAGYVQLALAADGHPLDIVTATVTHWLLARQMPDGRWLGNGINRAPSEYTPIGHTAIAVGGLKSYPLPGRRTEIAESLRRARQWLLAAEPKSAEERGMRLMGLVWTEAPRARVAAAIKQIRDRQSASGGWSQFDRTEPDAYATGMSLYAMHVAGVSPSDEAYRKGVDFLLRTQYQDGTWLVKTHAFPVQRYFESGFPFGRHQWISTAGTSWATLAIAQTLPDRPQERTSARVLSR
jgi:ankyrin repeat protein